MSVLRISNKKSQCRFCEKTWIECNERNILEYGKAEGPTPEQLYKKVWFMGKCDIWQFKNKSSNGCHSMGGK